MEPLLGEEKQFGIWPLITGTLLITAIAAVFALPIGLVTAIFLSEYAPMRVRNVVKPILEILAGVPTVVFGFFALTVLTPGLNWLGGVYNSLLEGTLAFDTYNAMAAGLAVGIMILPIVTSLAEDALRSVPKALGRGVRPGRDPLRRLDPGGGPRRAQRHHGLLPAGDHPRGR